MAAHLTGKDWPFPPIIVRKLDKPMKRKGKTYTIAIVDGVHRTMLALHSIEALKLAALGGKSALPAKYASIPVTVRDLSLLESEVEQLRTNLGHGDNVDKKHRDAWVKYLVKEKKIPAAKLAKELHITERSVFRMAAGTQTKTGPRKKSVKKDRATSNGNGDNGKETAAAWTPEAHMAMIHTIAKLTKSHADEVTEYVKQNKDKVSPWLEPFLDTLAGS
jgi:hypothetical protein